MKLKHILFEIGPPVGAAALLYNKLYKNYNSSIDEIDDYFSWLNATVQMIKSIDPKITTYDSYITKFRKLRVNHQLTARYMNTLSSIAKKKKFSDEVWLIALKKLINQINADLLVQYKKLL